MPTEPAYRRIAAVLRARIEDGTYPVGTKMPSLHKIEEEFASYGAKGSISRAISRKVYDLLKAERLVRGEFGHGYFVLPQRTTAWAAQRLIGSWSQGRSMWDVDPGTTGRQRIDDMIRLGPEVAPDHVADTLGVPRGTEVMVRYRRYILDGTPVLLSMTYLPLDLAAGTPMAEPHSGPGGIWARLKEAGHEPVRSPETVSARRATDDEAELLEVEPGSPVLEVLRTAWTADGRAVDVSEMAATGGYYRDYEIEPS